MEEYYLMLYLGADYIIPFIDSTKGNFFRYKSGSDGRLWLYFHEDVDSTDLLHGQDFYRPARMGKPSYFGEFWEHAERGDVISVHGVNTPYVELTKNSGMLKSLTEWYRSIVHSQSGAIPVVCIFSDSIPEGGRKNFMQMLSKSGFSIRSYSVSFSSLLAKNCALKPEYGKQIVLLEAAGNSVSLSSMIYLDDDFVSCGEATQCRYDGENPIKMALVKHVVDTNNREMGFFTEERLKSEYLYQMQYATQWLEQARKTPEDGSFLINYHLSIDSDRTYSLNVKKSFILSKQEDVARPILDTIDSFCERVGDANIVQYIYTGDIFSDEEMYEMASRLAPNKSNYVDSAYYGDVLHTYSKYYANFTESLDEFEVNMSQRANERESATAWFELAGRITDIAKRVAAVEPEFNVKVKALDERAGIALNSVETSLRSSKFDEADSALDALKDERGEIKGYISQCVERLLNEHVINRAIYDKVRSYTYANRIITEVNDSVSRICSSIERYEVIVKALEDVQHAIDYYRQNYAAYCNLRREFDRAQTLIEKRNLLEQMRPLTGEPLPDDPSDVTAVTGEISCKVLYKSGFLGFGKKPAKLEIRVKIGNVPLPYTSVLVVSDSPITFIDREKVCIELKKGEKGELIHTVDLPVKQFPKAKRLSVRIMVDRDLEQMADITKVSFNQCYPVIE
ncbi:MAG: hypothetical protein UHY58_03165 [Alistipes sp.]|nr:hypothetical protein [Alistipes sp.]